MKQLFVILTALGMLLSSCSMFKESVNLEYYEKEVVYAKFSDDYYENGNLKKCKLVDIATLDGYECIYWIHFFEDGRIKQFQNATVIAEEYFTIPVNSVIFYYPGEERKIENIWFSKNVVIDGIECKGGSKISTGFHENGKLRSCFITEDTEIQGFPCRSNLLKPVSFYQDGRLKEFTLCEDFTYESKSFEEGKTLGFNEEGSLTVKE